MSDYKGIEALYASFPVFTVKDTQIIATGLRKLYLVTDGKVTVIIDISRCIPCEYGFVHFLVFLTLLVSHSQVTHYSKTPFSALPEFPSVFCYNYLKSRCHGSLFLL